MGRARDEAEVLEHMAVQFRAGGGYIGPASHSHWREEKTRAIEAVDAWTASGIESVLDIGIGDQTHLSQWQRWAEVTYLGVDGCPNVLATARRRHPPGPVRAYVERRFGELVEEPKAFGQYDMVLLLDVLYHIPDDAIHDALLHAAFRARRAVVLSWATEVQDFGGQRPGEAGFAWFPRPRVGRFVRRLTHQGWEQVYRADFHAGVQKQRLAALVR
jgi:hypothetical protein